MSLINQLSINSQIQIEIEGLISSKIQGWSAQIFFALPYLELKNLNLVLIDDTMNTCPRLNRNLSFQRGTTFTSILNYTILLTTLSTIVEKVVNN